MEETRIAKDHTVQLRYLSLGLIALGLLGLATAWSMRPPSQIFTWQQAKGVVMDAPNYRYEAEGISYVASPSAEGLARGTEINVWYNPSDPAQSVAWIGNKARCLSLFVMGAILLLAGVLRLLFFRSSFEC